MRIIIPSGLILTLTTLLTFPVIAVAQWESETVATGGEKCAITVDAAGNPHISYIDNVDSDTLKYTHWNGTNWQTAVVEPASISGVTSIALDGSGNPHIVFSISSVWGELKHAWWDGSTWQQACVDSAESVMVGYYNSITFDGDGYPHIAYKYYKDYISYLKYAYKDASGWHRLVADSLYADFNYISLALDGNNKPHISYFDGSVSDLKYAHWTGSIWQNETVDAEGRVGKFNSIALDNLDYPCIAYFDNTNYGVKYARWDGSSWQIETVEQGNGCGFYTSLALDSNNHPHISSANYMSNLRFASWDGSVWQIEIIDETVSCEWTSIAIDDSGATHIAYYDDSQLVLKYASKHPIPVDVTPPAAPQSLVATPGDGEVSLVWQMNTEVDVVSYMIYSGTSANPTTLTDSTTTRNDTTKTIGDLLNNTKYYFRVTAVDDSGNESAYSIQDSATTFGSQGWHVSTTGSDDTGDGSTGNPFATIQYAINSAYHGDTVLVQPGTYVENINYNGKNVILGSLFLTTLDTSYISQTVIDGDASGSVVTFANGEDSTAVLSGLTITNGLREHGGGIGCWDYSSPSVFNVTISGNTAIHGGGIFCHNSSSPNLVNVVIKGNTADHMGGGIHIRSLSNPSLVNVTIYENTAYDGGGIQCWLNSSPKLMNVTIYGNMADFGGGISCYDNSNPTLTNVEILSNSASLGGGIAFMDSCSPTLENVMVRYNHATQNGGGLYFDGGSYLDNGNPAFGNVNVIENTAADSGGGFYIIGSSLIFGNVFVERNSAAYGGGICTNGDTELSNMTVVTNTSENGFGGIYAGNGNLTISNSNIAYNSVGLHNADNASITEASNNWWGHATGPYHSIQNPGGEGDSTNTFVTVLPWLTTPDIIAPPVPPQNLTVTGTGEDFISLSWDSSPLGDFACFNVHYRIYGSGVNFPAIDAGTDTSYSITGLPAGTTYHIDMTLTDTDGNGSWFSDGLYATTRVLEARNLDVGGGEDLQHLITHTPTISWDYFDSMGQTQDSYHIQVSSLSDFSRIDMWDPGEVGSESTSVAYEGAPLVDGNTYYLRIRFQIPGTQYWGLWSNIEFRMNSIPSAPVGIAPIENEVVSGSPNLSVSNSSDAEGDDINYRFDLYDDALLTFKLDSAAAVPAGVANTVWAVTAELPDNGQYWWTASANDGYESSSINGPYSFLVNTENNAPGAFTLLLPEEGITLPTQTPSFSWNTANDPDPIDTVRYSLVLLTQEPSITTIDVGTDTSYQVIDPLIDDTEYHWRVVARDLLGFEAINEGDLQSFIVNTENSPPLAAYLITPSDSSHEITLTPGFYWTESIDPDPGDVITYTLKYWIDPIYVASVPSDTNCLELITPLLDNSFYSWSVVSSDDHGGSVESESSMFWTDTYPEPPSPFLALLPADNSQGLSSQVEFVWHIANDPDPLDFATYNLIYATDWTDSATYTSVEGINDSTVSLSMNNNSEYFWLIEAVDKDGQVTQSNEGQPMSMVVGTLGIDRSNHIPKVFALHQNYPNPFNPTTQLRYDLPEQAFVQLTIYDLLGRQVTTPVNQVEEPGYRSVTWNGTDAQGKSVSAGMYLYVIKAGDFVQTRKMILLK